MLWGAEDKVLKDAEAKRQEEKGYGQPRRVTAQGESGGRTEDLVVKVKVEEQVEMGVKCCKDTQLKHRILW